MRHLRPVSRASTSLFGSSTTGTTPIESVILLLFSAFFSTYDNFKQVAQNLQKYYSKT